MKINRQWYMRNRMPKNPSLKEKVKWHLEHSRNCSCRPITNKVKEAIKPRC